MCNLNAYDTKTQPIFTYVCYVPDKRSAIWKTEANMPMSLAAIKLWTKQSSKVLWIDP